jgi:hypothetical protein
VFYWCSVLEIKIEVLTINELPEDEDRPGLGGGRKYFFQSSFSDFLTGSKATAVRRN